MEKTFLVPKISCGHCVNAIKNELSELENVHKVDGNPDDKTITVEWSIPVTEEDIRKAMTHINYPAK
jgi:copper chaperone